MSSAARPSGYVPQLRALERAQPEWVTDDDVSPIIESQKEAPPPFDRDFAAEEVPNKNIGDLNHPSARFSLLTAAQLREIQPPSPLVADTLFAGGFSSIIAEYGAYKSFIALSLDLCIGHGIDWFGRQTTPGLTVYQAGEGGPGLFSRVEAWRDLNGVAEISGTPFLPQSLRLNVGKDLADLLAVLRALPARPVKVTLDTFARSMRGNESSSEDTGLYVEAVDAIRETIGAHVQIVHHTGWEGTRSRGSTNIPASVDTEIRLARSGDRVTVSCAKQKDAVEFKPFVIEAVPIAGSLAFRQCAVATTKLTDTECRALASLQDAGSLKATEWERAAFARGVRARSFYKALKRLTELGYVTSDKNVYRVTDAGSRAL